MEPSSPAPQPPVQTLPPSSPRRAYLHPLVATAAISVIVLSAVGVTALVMNRSDATPSPYDAPRPVVAAVQADPVVPKDLQPEPQSQGVRQAPQPMAAAPLPAGPSAPSYSTGPSTPSYAPPAARQPVVPARPAAEAPRSIAQVAPACRNCGVVDSIREIKVKGEGTGVGAVGGAVVGGLLGNMVGAGRGKALATVAGAVGGGLGGNAIEKNVRSTVEHRMVVRLDDGTTRAFTQANPFPYGVGERIRIVNGHVERG